MEDPMSSSVAASIAASATFASVPPLPIDTAFTKPSHSLLNNLNGRLPSTPDEILETLRQAKESRLAGIPGIPAEEMIEDLERILAE